MRMAPQTEEELDELASEPDRGVVATVERIEGDIVVAGAGGKLSLIHISEPTRPY